MLNLQVFMPILDKHSIGGFQDFKWVIEKIGGGYGVILNPGYEVGLELEASMLDMLSNQ